MWQQEELQQWKSQSGFPPRLSMKTMGARFFLAGYYFFLSKCNRSPKIAFMNFFLLASVILWKPFLPPPFLPNLRSRTHNFLEMMETTKTFYFTKLNFSAHTPYPFYFKNTSCNRCLIRKYNRKP